jgi:hypothetical protein
MIIGDTIVAVETTGAASGTTTVYSPWISTWGNFAIFPFEIIAIGGGLAFQSFTARIFTKNSEDPDPGTAKGTLNTVTTQTPGTFSITDATGLLEMVRFEFKLNVRASGSLTAGFVHFRPLSPSWVTN